MLSVVAGQIIGSSNEVSLSSTYCWEYAKIGRDLGFGIGESAV